MRVKLGWMANVASVLQHLPDKPAHRFSRDNYEIQLKSMA